MANCCVILTGARGCLDTWCFCLGLAGFTLWCELPPYDKKFEVSVRNEVCISGGAMSLWPFTAVEDLAKATYCSPSVLLWQKESHFPRVPMPKMLCKKWLCAKVPAEKWSWSQLHPASSHCHQGTKFNVDWGQSPPVLTHRRNGRDEQHEITKDLVHLPLCLGFCSVMELRRVSLGLPQAFTKLPMNLEPRQGKFKMAVDRKLLNIQINQACYN